VIYFYPKDDTSGCTREAQDFTEMAGDYARPRKVVACRATDEEARQVYRKI
jgi:peroxiredoxin Q/BCP